MIKLFEEYNDIASICKKYGIKDYIINPDGSIDIDGYVDISYEKLTKIPLKFGKVSGFFDCSNNQLTTLKNASKEVGRYFSCSGNKLPKLINDNIGYIYDIIRCQDDYGIWNLDDTLNKYRFNDMMEEIKELKLKND